jgi:hypothetical protein
LDFTPEQRRLSPVAGSTVRADFTGGEVSSDLGALVLSAGDRRSGLIDRLTGAIADYRNPRDITHPLHAGKICATCRLSVSQLARTQQFRR